MKVLHVYHEYPKTYQHYLLKPLSEIRKFGESKVLTFQKCNEADYNVISEKGRDLIQRILFKMGLTPYQTSFERIASSFDIIHLHHSFLFPKILALFNGRSDFTPKIIITLRGKDTYIKPWVQQRWTEFYNAKSQYVDRFCVVSNDQKKYLHEKWQIDPNKISVIPVSVTLPDVFKTKSIVGDSIKIISVFRFTWEKNIKDTLKTIHAIKQKGYKVEYTVCGDGVLLSMMYFLIDKYDLKNEVKLVGRVSPNDLTEHLRRNNFFLQLSDSEALSASSIEAQYAGLPGIVSNAGGLPETIVDKKSGYVVETDDYVSAAEKIIFLYINPIIYSRFSEMAIRNAKARFSLENEYGQLKELYQSFI
jgi:glycosyltransferase involved in cell wall biosynthesis